MCPVIGIINFEIDNYILLYVTASVVAVVLLRHELNRNHYAPHLYITLTVVGLIAGLIGSRLYNCFEFWNEFVANPIEFFLHTAGSGWYGAFIFGSSSILLTLKIKKLPILRTADIIILIIPLSQVFGRLGCFFAGCCHGIPSNLPWAVRFPNGSVPASVTVHPTQLYEIFIYLFVFILLWKLRKREMRAGMKLSLYLILAGLGRFIVEFYRLTPKVLFGLTVPQLIAISGVILGIFIILRAVSKYSLLKLNFTFPIERR